MKSLLKILSVVLFGLLFQDGVAQQLTTNNLYTQNRFLFNPANTGDHGGVSAFLNARRQWLGVDGSAMTSTFGIHSPISKNMSLGGILINEDIGVYRRFSGALTYSYKVNITTDQSLTLGISGGFEDFRVRPDLVSSDDMPDILNVAEARNRMSFRAGFGIRYKWQGLEIDLVAPQLFIKDYNDKQQFAGMLSYTAEFSSLSVQPSVMYKTIPYDDAKAQIDANLVIMWSGAVWGGFTYRMATSNSMIFKAGLSFSDLHLGYAYEMSSDGVANYADGTHELVLAAKFGKKKKRAVTESID